MEPLEGRGSGSQRVLVGAGQHSGGAPRAGGAGNKGKGSSPRSLLCRQRLASLGQKGEAHGHSERMPALQAGLMVGGWQVSALGARWRVWHLGSRKHLERGCPGCAEDVQSVTAVCPRGY